MVSGRSENIEMKIIIDVGITALLFFLSGYQFWGQAAHEWAGIIMLALLIVHNIFKSELVQKSVQRKISGSKDSISDNGYNTADSNGAADVQRDCIIERDI